MSSLTESTELQSENKMSSDDLNQDFKTDDSIDLHLTADHHHHRRRHQHHNHSSHSPCSSCGCFGSASKTNKRHSPESISEAADTPYCSNSPMHLPKRPKRLEFDPPESLSGFSIPPGFSKISLPPPAAQTLISGRSDDATRQSPPPEATRNVQTANDSSATPSSKTAEPSPLPPLSPLRRAWSLPSPNNQSVPSTSSDVVLAQPPQLHGEKLKVMGEWIKEVAKWWDECQTVAEIKPVNNNKPEEEVSDENAADHSAKDGGEGGCEESVNVERTGECLIINFKCPCKKGYQILLCGTSCYYKLM